MTDCLFQACDFCSGIATDEGKIEAIKKWPILKNIMAVQSFLGFIGYYCQFILKFMQVAKPLYKLTSGKMVARRRLPFLGQQVPTGLWWPEKIVCTIMPILAKAEFTQPFKLHTDACGSGLRAFLYQTYEDGTDTVITCASIGAWWRLNPITWLTSLQQPSWIQPVTAG